MYRYKRTIFFQCQKTYQRKNVNVIQRGPEITIEKQMTMPHQVRIRNVTSPPFSPVTAIAENGLSALLKLTTRKCCQRFFQHYISALIRSTLRQRLIAVQRSRIEAMLHKDYSTASTVDKWQRPDPTDQILTRDRFCQMDRHNCEHR